MHNVVDRQTETDVLENCAKTLIFLCNEDQAIYSLCDVSRTNLINGLVNKSRVVLANHQTLIADVSLVTLSFFRFM
jgi:cohesin complex subunit SA-1/2